MGITNNTCEVPPKILGFDNQKGTLLAIGIQPTTIELPPAAMDVINERCAADVHKGVSNDN